MCTRLVVPCDHLDVVQNDMHVLLHCEMKKTWGNGAVMCHSKNSPGPPYLCHILPQWFALRAFKPFGSLRFGFVFACLFIHV